MTTAQVLHIPVGGKYQYFSSSMAGVPLDNSQVTGG